MSGACVRIQGRGLSTHHLADKSEEGLPRDGAWRALFRPRPRRWRTSSPLGVGRGGDSSEQRAQAWRCAGDWRIWVVIAQKVHH